MVDALLHAGADVKAANDLGATALYAAAASTDPAMTEKLLAAAPIPMLISRRARPAVQAVRGNLATVRLLLCRRRRQAQEANGEQNALMWGGLARTGHGHHRVAGHGADIKALSKGGFTALMLRPAGRPGNRCARCSTPGASPNDVARKNRDDADRWLASAMGHIKAATSARQGAPIPTPSMPIGSPPCTMRRAGKGRCPGQRAAGAWRQSGCAAQQEKRTASRPTTWFFEGVDAAGARRRDQQLDAVKALVAGAPIR